MNTSLSRFLDNYGGTESAWKGTSPSVDSSLRVGPLESKLRCGQSPYEVSLRTWVDQVFKHVTNLRLMSSTWWEHWNLSYKPQFLDSWLLPNINLSDNWSTSLQCYLIEGAWSTLLLPFILLLRGHFKIKCLAHSWTFALGILWRVPFPWGKG